MNIFKRKILGIDIGSGSIKAVEASIWGRQKKLENYAEIKSSIISKDPLLLADEKGNLLLTEHISSALKEILKEARIKTKNAVFALPDFLTFSAFFEIPQMSKKEIEGAIYYNASRYLTLPISEVTLDWKIIPNSNDRDGAMKIFLTAVPNQVVSQYQKVAQSVGLELKALEPEVFGLARALTKLSKSTVCMIDMGHKTSTINIVDKGYLRRSYSSNFGGNQLSLALSGDKPLIDALFSEIKGISADLLAQDHVKINEFYLTGGVANLPGLKEYFAENFKNPVSIPNCFEALDYPKVLKNSLVEMSPRFSVAMGVALGMLD